MYTNISKVLTSHGLFPKILSMDNDVSTALVALLTTKSINIQLVLPRVHRYDSIERATQAFEVHFISILCGTDVQFLINSIEKVSITSSFVIQFTTYLGPESQTINIYKNSGCF